jgi:hypothetical protein
MYHNMWANSTLIKLFVNFFQKIDKYFKKIRIVQIQMCVCVYIYIYIHYVLFLPSNGSCSLFSPKNKIKVILYLVHAHEKV